MRSEACSPETVCTTSDTAGVHGSYGSRKKPSARCRCLAPLDGAPAPAPAEPAAAHLEEGVEEVPEGPGVDSAL